MHPLVSFYCFVLKDYLETKRLVFARFYFLSNEDLLDILANSSKNPDAVQVCMIFDPLKYKPFLLLIFFARYKCRGPTDIHALCFKHG